jgi:CheY-like chemotaxis protein
MHRREAPPGAVDILIAEDDAPLRLSLRFLLEQQGYTCAEAVNGREAVAIAQHAFPQCVLLDLIMPELDGLAVARQLRADPRTRGTHIHCMTGCTDGTWRERARLAGCDQLLLKPIDLGELLQVIRVQVRRPPPEWITGLTKTEAENLLDWLEANGYPPGEVDYETDKGFAVRCRKPASGARARGHSAGAKSPAV